MYHAHLVIFFFEYHRTETDWIPRLKKSVQKRETELHILSCPEKQAYSPVNIHQVFFL